MSGISSNRIKRRRPRKTGDLAALKRMLWGALIEAEYRLAKADDDDNETAFRAIHAIGTVGGAYARLLESTDVEQRMQQLEVRLAALGSRNGHAVAAAA